MASSAPMSADEAVVRMSLAWRELRRGAATVIVRDQLFGDGPDALDPVHIDVLDLLVQRKDWRMHELAAALRVDPSTVTRTVQRMEAAGLAARAPDRHDGRVVRVHATVTGREGHAAIAARRSTIIGQILIGFDEPDRQRLVELVERFIAGADAYAGLPLRAPVADEAPALEPGQAATAAG